MRADDWFGLALVVTVYGALLVSVWWLGWRTWWDLLLAIHDGLARKLEDMVRELEHGQRTRTRSQGRVPATVEPGWCTCRASAPLVPIAGLTGEILDHRCPTCWLPRDPTARPVPTLPDPGRESGPKVARPRPRRVLQVGPHVPDCAPIAVRTWGGDRIEYGCTCSSRVPAPQVLAQGVASPHDC